MPPLTDPVDRVRIWNSYLTEAYLSAKRLSECDEANDYPPLELDGGVLSTTEHYSLMTVLTAVLAIEARANHLIHELHDEGRINKSLRDAAARLPTRFKWFLIPKLAGSRRDLDPGIMPHQAVSELCGHRNEFVHVTFGRRILDRLPSRERVLRLYNGFVTAMEDMNVVLGKTERRREAVINKLTVQR